MGDMSGGRVVVDYVTRSIDEPLVRFSAEPAGVAVLWDAFDQLAAGGTVAAVQDLELVGLSSIEFCQGIRGGLRSPAPGQLIFDGDRGQWETRAHLLDQLTRSAQGFQYLDYEGGDELSAVVTTYADGSF